MTPSQDAMKKARKVAAELFHSTGLNADLHMRTEYAQGYVQIIAAALDAERERALAEVEAGLRRYREAYAEDLCPGSIDIEDIAPDERTRVAFRMGRFVLDNCIKDVDALKRREGA